MQKWEYCVVGPISRDPDVIERENAGISYIYTDCVKTRTVDNKKEFPQIIAQLGNEGWELTGVTPIYQGSAYTHHILYFKRPKSE